MNIEKTEDEKTDREKLDDISAQFDLSFETEFGILATPEAYKFHALLKALYMARRLLTERDKALAANKEVREEWVADILKWNAIAKELEAERDTFRKALDIAVKGLNTVRACSFDKEIKRVAKVHLAKITALEIKETR